MRNPAYSIFWGVLMSASLLLPVLAQTDSTPTAPVGSVPPSAGVVTPTQTGSGGATIAQDQALALSYGVADVVNLTRAQISENIILTYVQNSGTLYALGSKEV